MRGTVCFVGNVPQRVYMAHMRTLWRSPSRRAAAARPRPGVTIYPISTEAGEWAWKRPIASAVGAGTCEFLGNKIREAVTGVVSALERASSCDILARVKGWEEERGGTLVALTEWGSR